MRYPCNVCQRSFRTTIGLSDHKRDMNHDDYCLQCQRSFVSQLALQAHLRDSPRHQVDSSDSEDFFDTSSDGSNSGEDSEGEVDPYCQGCNRWFVNVTSLYAHLRDSSAHNWCFICSRDFGTEASLVQHANSITHKNRDMKCPFCEEKFKSPSGVAFHVESGCHKVTRHQVTAAVHALNIVPTISISHRIAGGPSNHHTDSLTTLIATEASFNGKAYQCCMTGCWKSFRTLAALNSHLNSPAHDRDEFKCPKCNTKFKLISGLVQHIESGVCKAAQLKKVEEYYGDLTAAFTRALKL